ncbi:MAG TPA: hypothetical protein DEQ47_06495, partial [Solibacterales bacterium]|nr:hypothetical protein [Bryobacterales bacterium]
MRRQALWWHSSKKSESNYNHKTMRRSLFVPMPVALLMAGTLLNAAPSPNSDPRMQHAFRKPQQNGWTFVHLEGTPAQIGYQHGVLLAPEIDDGAKVLELEAVHDSKRDWKFFREAAKTVLWPHIEREYREELQGIADGVRARGVKLDVWDIVAINASLEW